MGGNPAPGREISWIHLSDLHMQQGNDYDTNVVLGSLLQDVDDRVHHDGMQPDWIIISGDVAFAGQPEEYAMACRFFDELLAMTRLGRDRLFVVPGNHDVDRGSISTLAAGAAGILQDRRAVNRFLASDGDRALVMLRLHAYAAFVNSYFGSALMFDDSRYFYTRRLDVGGLTVAVLGLNSAWLAYGGEDDRGRILLGERQVRAALAAADGADLRLAVLHHPLDWLKDFDRADAEALLLGRCDFVLHGHLHRVGLLQARTPDSQAMVVSAGACYETRDRPNAYNWVRLDPASGRGTVWLRMYSDRQGGFWTKDVLNYRGVPDGVYEFALPERLGSVPAGRGAWDGAVPARVSPPIEPGYGAGAGTADPWAGKGYVIPVIRDLLRKGFSADELYRLCYDDPALKPVLTRFGPGFSLDNMIDVVLEYCEKRLAFGELLAAVRQANPQRYKEYEDRLIR